MAANPNPARALAPALSRRQCLLGSAQALSFWQAEGVQAMEPLPDWGEGCQAAPDFEADQRISW
jgi:hypothetical protein